MKKLLFLALFLFTLSSSSLVAQGTSQKMFLQNPETQASMAAAADNMIDELVNQETGESYFVRKLESDWSDEVNYIDVLYDPEFNIFIDANAYAVHGEEKGNGSPQKPCPGKKDTCIHKQPNLIKIQEPKAKPRRSSRVKLADNF